MCHLGHEDTTHDGVVMDVSSTGLFVLTTFAPRCGDEITVTTQPEGDIDAMTIRARVVRHRLASVNAKLVSRGLGLTVLDAPPGFDEIAEDEIKALGSDPTSDELLDMAQAVVDVLIESGEPCSQRALIDRSGIAEAAWPRVLGVLIDLDQIQRTLEQGLVYYRLARN